MVAASVSWRHPDIFHVVQALSKREQAIELHRLLPRIGSISSHRLSELFFDALADHRYMKRDLSASSRHGNAALSAEDLESTSHSRWL